MGKNIVLCSDGTGQAGGQGFVSNVWRIFKAVDRHHPHQEQVAFHVDGVGTEQNKYMRAIGGAFGWGLSEDIRQLYAALVRSYRDGDNVFLFGFSRGAFTVRSLAGMIDQVGILDRARFASDDQLMGAVKDAYSAYRRGRQVDRDSICKERKIRFLGVWDTVDAVGVPIDELRDVIYQVAKCWRTPHRHELNPSVENAFHAISIDDERHTFHPMIWDESQFSGSGDIQQVWFAGVHSNVGGGYPKDSLAFISLDWMMKHAHGCGLRFDTAKWKDFGSGDYAGSGGDYQTQADRNGRIYDSRGGIALYYRYKPRMIGALWEKENSGTLPIIHESALRRIASGYTRYAPTAIPERFEFKPTWDFDFKKVADENANDQSESGQGGGESKRIGRGPDLSVAKSLIAAGRVLYFAFLLWTFAFLLAGVILDNESDDPCGGNGFCDGALSFAKTMLPDFSHGWLESYAANAGTFWILVGAYVVLAVVRKFIKTRTASAASAAWKDVEFEAEPKKNIENGKAENGTGLQASS